MATSTWDAWGQERRRWLGGATRRLVGGLVVLASLYVGLALWGYAPSDPSLNHATRGVVQNPMGIVGAHVADILLQSFGLTAWLLPIVGLARGTRELLGRSLDWAWLPLVALPMALLAAAAWAADLPMPTGPDWPFRVGAGGFVGDFLLGRLSPVLGTALYPWLTALAALVLSLLALGLRWSEWLHGLGGVRRGLRWAGEHAGPAMQAGAGLMRRAGETVAAHRPEHWRLGAAAPASPEPKVRLGLLAQLRSRFSGLMPQPVGDTSPNAGARMRPRGFDPRAADVDDEPADSAGLAPSRTGRLRTAPVKPSRRDEAAIAPASATASAAKAGELDFGSAPVIGSGDPFELPGLDLLTPPKRHEGAVQSRAAAQETARQLEAVLDDFGVRGQIIDVKPGPVVTLFELEPAPGTRSQRVISLADDIARSLSAISVRVATVPGRNVIGIELPNERRATVYLRELLEADTYQRSEARLPMALGQDISGKPMVVDLARMPHLLIAGTTGSGKSVAINAMILSLLYRLTPSECRIIMIDPKVIELSVYEDIPHLLAPVVTEPHKAVVALKWVVRQMDERYRLMSHLGVRDIFAFNRRILQAKARGEELKRRVRTGFEPGTGLPIMEDQPIDMTPLPLIVVIVDEVADLMLTAGKEIEHCIQRLSQKARAAGVHLIVATQRPSVDVLTGVIKANLPSRISFRVSSKIDSRTILGDTGAEQLLGQGDMLYLMPGDRISRIHGPLVTDGEVEAVVRHLKAQGRPDYDDAVTSDGESDSSSGGGGDAAGAIAGGDGNGDALYQQAVEIVARDGKASTSYLQRKLAIGYNSAAKLIERMENDGLITRADHVGRRQVLMGRGGVDGNQPTEV